MQIKSLKDKLEKAKSASSDLPQNNQEMEDLKKEVLYRRLIIYDSCYQVFFSVDSS